MSDDASDRESVRLLRRLSVRGVRLMGNVGDGYRFVHDGDGRPPPLLMGGSSKRCGRAA